VKEEKVPERKRHKETELTKKVTIAARDGHNEI